MFPNSYSVHIDLQTDDPRGHVSLSLRYAQLGLFPLTSVPVKGINTKIAPLNSQSVIEANTYRPMYIATVLAAVLMKVFLKF